MVLSVERQYKTFAHKHPGLMGSRASFCLQLLSGCHLFMEEFIPVCTPTLFYLLLSHNYAVRYKALLCAIKAGPTWPAAMHSAHTRQRRSTVEYLTVFLLCYTYQGWDIR